MQPSEKCVSLETAGKLKDAGFPQDTEKQYGYYIDPLSGGKEGVMLCHTVDCDMRHDAHVAAPDATEIGELLPPNFGSESHNWNTDKVHVGNDGDCWEASISLTDSDGGSVMVEIYGNEAEARAACWLYLKQNNLL